jgi:hypothetical protein
MVLCQLKIAGLARQAAPEPEDVADLRPRQRARDPQVRAGREEQEESQVAGPGDRAADRPSLPARAEPPVPVGHLAEEGAWLRRRLAEDRARIRMHVERARAERDRGRPVDIGEQREGRWCGVRHGGARGLEDRLRL